MENQNRLPEYLTVQQLSDESGLPAGVILAALRRGEIAAIRAGKGKNGAYRVRREAFEQWLQRKEAQA